MNTLNIVYPHYWQTPESYQGFLQHLALIKVHFGHQKPLGPNGTFVLTLVDGTFFEHQFNFFEVTIQHQSKQAMEPPFDDNPTSYMWKKMVSFAILNQWLLEQFKCVDLCLVIVLGSVENKHFLQFEFYSPSWGTTHLDLVVHTYAQHFFKLENFPFYYVIID